MILLLLSVVSNCVRYIWQNGHFRYLNCRYCTIKGQIFYGSPLKHSPEKNRPCPEENVSPWRPGASSALGACLVDLGSENGWITGWWLTYPLWKIWVRQLGWWHSQYMENKKCLKPPTNEIMISIAIWGVSINGGHPKMDDLHWKIRNKIDDCIPK